MKNFNKNYKNLPDYILKCAAQIWEGRDIVALDWHYADDLIVRSPDGVSHGNAAGEANTMATLTEFPDRELLGEDVIWCGDENAGFCPLIASYLPQHTKAELSGPLRLRETRRLSLMGFQADMDILELPTPDGTRDSFSNINAVAIGRPICKGVR